LNTSKEMFEVLIRNIISNANQYAIGQVILRVNANSLETCNETLPEMHSTGGSKLGLRIIERICNSLDWKMTRRLINNEFQLTIEFTSG